MRNYLAILFILTASVLGYTAADRVIQTQKLHVSEPAASGTSKVILTAPALGSDYTLTLPTTAGTSGYVSVTDGSGVMSWVNTLTGFTLASPTITGATITSPSLSGATLSGSTTFSALTANTVPYLNGSKVLTSSAVTPTELGYVSGVTSAIQTQINTKAPSASPTFTGTVTTPVTASRALATGASNELVASATTATELGYVSGVTSAIQTQINTKAPSASPTFTGTVTTPVTASRALATGALNELVASATTATELGYVSGVTSAIQTQLNAKAPSSSPTLSNPTFTGTVTTPVTASRALATGASNELVASATTATELGYVSGVTSAIQTQIDSKVNKSTYSAKGSLLAATAASTPADVPVGTDGYVLTSNSTEPTGVKWVSPGAVVTSPGGSDTQVQYNDGGVMGADALFVFDDTNNFLGVGTASPSGPLHAVSSNNASMYFQNSVVGGSGVNLTMRYSTGTPTAPGDTGTTDTLSNLYTYGYATGGWKYGSAITTVQDGAVGTGYLPSNMKFSVGNSAGTALTEVLRLEKDGDALVGGLHSSAGKLSVISANDKGVAVVSSDESVKGYFTPSAYDTASVGLYTTSAYPLVFGTNSTAVAEFDTGGRFLLGSGLEARNDFFSTANTYAPAIQIEGTTASTAMSANIKNSNDTSGSRHILAKTRGTTNGATTVVQSGDEAGGVSFQGSDGTNFVELARVMGAVDGTPGASDMPGRLVFSTTADGAAAITERMRIDSSGKVGINTTTPEVKLHLATETDSDGINIDTASAGEGGQFNFRSSAGSLSAKSNSGTSAVLGDLAFYGYASSAYRGGVLLRASQNGSYTSNTVPSQLEVHTGDGTNAVAQRLVVGATGNISVNTGNVVMSTSGKGIDFSATANSSGTMTSELLSDYEEGTWVPSVGGSATYTTQVGKYTKNGRHVNTILRLLISNIGTGSQSTISGLPFTSSASEPNGACYVHYWGGAAASYVYMVGYIAASGTSIQLAGASGAATGLTSPLNAMTTNTELRMVCDYYVD